MKGLILHCKNFSFKDTEKSTKPAGISQVTTGVQLTEGKFQDKVVILACFERNDTEKEIKAASEHISQMIENWHSANHNILVVPFAHLSTNLADPKQAKELIESLIKKLRGLGNKVNLITFGTHKEWLVDVYGYPRATSWFQFP